MVIADPSLLANMIMSAAEKANCRVVVQSSWSKLDVSASDRCHMVGPCPHDWLLPQTCAVVHHGGAGTTAAGLRWGLPTFICPFVSAGKASHFDRSDRRNLMYGLPMTMRESCPVNVFQKCKPATFYPISAKCVRFILFLMHFPYN
jgi:hypothetical protein